MEQFNIEKFKIIGGYILLLKEYRCDDIPPKIIPITEYQTVFDELIAIKCPALFEGIIMVDKYNAIRSTATSLIGDLYMTDNMETETNLEINQKPNDETPLLRSEKLCDKNTKSMKLHEFLEKLYLYWSNIHPVSVGNQLAKIFMIEDENCEADILAERNRYEKSDTIYSWFDELPRNYQKMVLKYYSNCFNIVIDATKSYKKEELVHYVNDMGHQGGGEIEGKGKCHGENITIIIDQNEWHDTAVCIFGGYGHYVTTIGTEEILQKMPDILDLYFDHDTTFIVEI